MKALKYLQKCMERDGIDGLWYNCPGEPCGCSIDDMPACGHMDNMGDCELAVEGNNGMFYPVDDQDIIDGMEA